MKIILSICFSFLMLICNQGVAQSIKFIDQPASWEEVVKKSKAQNKPIFVDVFTEWCGPCKWMDQNVFNQKEVADYMNANFISVKIDAEKGYGVEFAKEHKISGYPSYLYFNAEGQVTLSASGSVLEERFLRLSEQAIENATKNITFDRIKIEIGSSENDPIILKEKLLSLSGMENGGITGNLLDMYLDLLPRDSLHVPSTQNMVRHNITSPVLLNGNAMNVLTHIYKEKPIHESNLMGAWLRIQALLINHVDSLGVQKNEKGLEELLFFVDDLYSGSEMATFYKLFFKARYNAYSGNYPEFEANLDTFAQRYIHRSVTIDIPEIDEYFFKQNLIHIYGEEKLDQIKESELKDSQQRYYNFPRIILDNFAYLIDLYKIKFNKSFEQKKQKELNTWLQQAIENYSSNKFYVSESLVKLYNTLLN